MAKTLTTNQNSRLAKESNIPTQKNIVSIIKSYINDVDEVINILINNSKRYDSYKNVIKQIDNYQKICSAVFSNKGVLFMIINSFNSINIESYNKKINAIKLFINGLSNLMEFISIKIVGMGNIMTSMDLTLLNTTYLKTIDGINKIMEIIDTIKIKPFIFIKLLLIRFQFYSIKNFIDKIAEDSIELISSTKKCITAFVKFKTIDVIINSLNSIFDKIYGIKINLLVLRFKTHRIKNALNILLKLFKKTKNTKIEPTDVFNTLFAIGSLSLIINAVVQVINVIKNTKIGIKFVWKLMMFKFALTKLVDVISILNKIKSNSLSLGKLKSLLVLSIITNIVIYIFKMIRGAKIGILLMMKFFILNKAIKALSELITTIANIKYNISYLNKVRRIKQFVKALIGVFSVIMLLLPIIILSTVAMPIFTLAIGIFAVSLKAMFIIIKWAGKNIAKSILNILLIKSFILSISIIMLIFALVAVSVIHVASSVLLFIGIVALVVIEIGLLGGLVILAAPILVPALLAFGVVALAILGLAAIAGLLKLIEVINLDKDKISENIHIIFDTVKEISSIIFSDGKTKENKPVGWLQKIGSFIGNILGAIGSALLTISFLSLSIIAIFSVIFIGGQLVIIQSLKLDKNLITSNVETIISTTKKVIELIDEIDGDVEIKDVKRFRRIKRIVNQITKIAKNLNKIGKVELEQNIILDKVGTIFTFIGKLQGYINDMLYGGDETKQTVSEIADFIPIARFVKNRAEAAKDNQAKRKLNRISKITNTLNNIGSTLTSIQNLNIDESIITQKVTDIFTFIGNLDATIFKFMSEGTKDSNDIIDSAKLSKREWKKANKKLSKIEGVIATLQEIGSALNIIKDLNLNEIKDEKSGKTIKTTILDNIKTIFNSIDSISLAITKNSNTSFDAKKAEQLTPLIDYITKLNNGFANISSADSSSVEKNIGNYIKFVDKVNTIDVERIKTTSQMFEQMSNFSNSIKGDFDKLAESLSEKLLPVLEELKEVMSDVPEKIDIGFQNTSASIAATNAAPTKENITAQVNRENPNLDEETINRLVNERLNERAKADANGIEAKLDALITLLKGQGANRVVVHTI